MVVSDKFRDGRPQKVAVRIVGMTHSHIEETKNEDKKPVPKSLKIIGGIFAALFVIGGIGILFEEEPDPVEVPEVAGLPGDEARSLIRDAGFSPTTQSDTDEMVIRDSNWVAESTTPAAGEMIVPDEEVTINVVRPDDPEPELNDQEEGQAEAEETSMDVSHDPDDFAEYGGTTYVRFEISDHFTQGMIASGAERKTFEALEAAIEEYPETGRVQVIGSFPTVDEYGNEEMSEILQPVYLRETIDQINFENWPTIDIWSLRDGGMVNQQLMDNR